MMALLRMVFPLLLCALLGNNCLAQPRIITTYVGPGMPVIGSPAVTQSLDGPSVATDNKGGFYVASSSQNRVYRVGTDGRLRLVAGTGTSGYSGDGGPAVSAQLAHPTSIAVDSAGNLYIADFGNHRIRKVSPDGIITTVAGNGISGFSGDGGPATSAQLNQPESVAVDASGNLYIADTANIRIRRVSSDGVIVTIAGDGQYLLIDDAGNALSAPLAIAYNMVVDSGSNLYIAMENRIRKITPDGIITTVAGKGTSGFSGDGGPATSAQFNSPYGMAVDLTGNLYIADSYNNRIRKVTPDGVITTITGNGTYGFSGDGGPAVSAQITGLGSIAVDSDGNVFIADYGNECIRKITPEGIIRTVAGNPAYGFSGDRGPTTSANLNHPEGEAVDSKGNLYIADTLNHRICKVTPDRVITTIAGVGTPGFSGDGGSATSAQLNHPEDLALDSAGNLYIADTYNHRIRKVASDGVIITIAGNGTYGYSGDGGRATSAPLNHPGGVSVDSAGNLYIADTENHRIRKVTPNGMITTVAGNGDKGYNGDGGKATSARLDLPDGIDLDSADNLYIIFRYDTRIRKVTPDGLITAIAGIGKSGYMSGWARLNDGTPIHSSTVTPASPHGIAVDSANNLYVSVEGFIRKITPDGMVTVIAGNGTDGYSGDGGPATSAQLSYYPGGVAVDSAGNLYIADTSNNRIRKVSPDTR